MLGMVAQANIASLVLPAKQARSRIKRDRLLAAGRELLNRGAFEATSIGDIAKEAGCSVGAFYQRFPDKEAFFSAVVETVMADIAADAERFVRAEDPPRSQPASETGGHVADEFSSGLHGFYSV